MRVTPPIKRPPGFLTFMLKRGYVSGRPELKECGVCYIWSPGEGIRAFQSGFSQGLERQEGEGGVGVGGGGGRAAFTGYRPGKLGDL